ncbi:hypothetical protein ERJ75_001410100 [Trypanosoma vivax]|nr:hypothetical protein ERJ75_001410100 [Trypanosoma vivax]
MERVGVICEASQKSTKGWVVPFAVVEEKAAGPRRRFAAWPKGENDRDDCEAEALLKYASRRLAAAFGDVEAMFCIAVPFFKVSLPQGNRASFRCRAGPASLPASARLPMGYKRYPEALRTVARALAGGPVVVKSRCAAPQSLKICVWIGNIRIGGLRWGVEKRSRVATLNARRCGALLGERNCVTKKREFIGAPFGREAGAVCLKPKNGKEDQGGAAAGKTRGGGVGMPYAAHGARRSVRAQFLSQSSVSKSLKAQRGTFAP